ncbi:L-threonylcarbamoyladenylate synthase [Candidatus Omnitrophota bacterium]
MKKTEIIKLDSHNPDQEKINFAAEVITNGGLVVFPTETVYGIAANALNAVTVDRLSQVKRRPEEKKYSIHIAHKEDVEKYASNIPTAAYKLMDRFWPGPLTIILQSKHSSSGTVGLRLPNNNIALKLIETAGVPVFAPSANVSGKHAPAKIEDVLKDLKGLVDIVIDGGVTEFGVSSSVVDVAQIPARLMREGVIKKEEILKVINSKHILFVCTGNSCRSVMAAELMKKKVAGRDDIFVESAGVGALPGMSASESTIELLKKEGIDARAHRSQGASDDLVKRSDLILVMERHHKNKLLSMFPFAKERTFLLKEFVKIGELDVNIPDPIGMPMGFYANCFSVIQECIEEVYKKIQ